MNKKINTFILVIILLSIVPFYRIIEIRSIYLNPSYVLFIMWTPAIAAFITKLIFDRSLKGLGFKMPKIQYIGMAYSIPFIAGFIVYSIAWLTDIGGLDFNKIDVFDIIGVSGVALSLVSALGEEIGWRGFLVPELAKKFSYTKTSIIMSIIWSVYHYPLMIFSDYNNGISVILSLIIFTVSVTAICFITTWLTLKSKSLWPSAILHASHNYYIQSVLDVMTINTKYTKLFTSEFGIGLALCYVFIAFLFLKKRNQLSNEIE